MNKPFWVEGYPKSSQSVCLNNSSVTDGKMEECVLATDSKQRRMFDAKRSGQSAHGERARSGMVCRVFVVGRRMRRG